VAPAGIFFKAFAGALIFAGHGKTARKQSAGLKKNCMAAAQKKLAIESANLIISGKITK